MIKSASDRIVIVGGGVFGCATAFELAKRSADILLIDKHLPGRATSASAGGLWPVGEAVGLGCGVIFHAKQTESGQAKGRIGPEPLPDVFREFLIESNKVFPTLAEELLEVGGVDIEYEEGPGLLYVMLDEHERAVVSHLIAGLPSSNGIEVLTQTEISQLEPNLSQDLVGGVLLPGEHQVNPMFLSEAFKRAAMNLGATVRGDCQVTGIRRSGDRIIGVEIGDEFLPADVVINAAGSWSAQLASSANLHIPIHPVRGQVVLTESLSKVMNVCLSTSKCYLTQKQHGEMLIGSTTENVGFDVSVTEDAIRNLSRGAIRAMPLLQNTNIKRIWSGLRPGTPDEMPILGAMSGVEGYINATGGFRTGIVAAPLTGKILAQLVNNEVLSFAIQPFMASRFTEN